MAAKNKPVSNHTLDKEFLNLLVKKCAKKQNSTKKLNAGQWREAITIVGEVISEMATKAEIKIRITDLD